MTTELFVAAIYALCVIVGLGSMMAMRYTSGGLFDFFQPALSNLEWDLTVYGLTVWAFYHFELYYLMFITLAAFGVVAVLALWDLVVGRWYRTPFRDQLKLVTFRMNVLEYHNQRSREYVK